MSNLFRAALSRQNDGRPPVWFMRQAGRYHSHYRRIRERHSFVDLCKQPQIATLVTMGPIEEFDFDAAILFSDLLFPLEVLGMPLDYTPGPTLGWHLQKPSDLARLDGNDGDASALAFQAQALRGIRAQLPNDKGLIGFVGGALTLFYYAAEGSHQGALRNAHAGLTDGRYEGFCARLLPLLARNMALQWGADIDCLAVLDTCAGELTPEEFGAHLVPQLSALLDEFHRLCPDGKVLYYSKGTDARHWRQLRKLNLAGIGIDWRTRLADALQEFGEQWAIQGNFDPHALLLPENDFERAVEGYFAPLLELPPALRRGWICGLGHGVLPPTPERHVHVFIDLQRELFS